jgi:hypothetical protein
MTHNTIRRFLFVGIILASWVAQPPAARADSCRSSCGSGHRVCTTQARTAAKACLQSCGSGGAARACQAGCVRTFRSAQTTCRAARADCGTSCPAPLAAVDPCAGTCSGTAQACLTDALNTGQACLQTCPADTGLPGCWAQCAADLRNSGAACVATLQGCLNACQGPASGFCFDTIALQCTAEACSPGQACSQPNEFCSPRCATPPPGGTCFDPSTMQCTQQPCSPSQPCAETNQTCVPECPLPPPKGTCFDTTAKVCTGQPCAPGASCGAPNLVCTLQCPSPPLPTPTPPCTGVPCAGTCTLPVPCPFGVRCPGALGQCQTDSAGGCSCVAIVPTPPATPTPQCGGVPCGGSCIISPPCPSGRVCPEIASLLGQCALDSTGTCQCVPSSPGPTRTPQATPTPQCQSVPCGGSCIISPCPPGSLCPIRLGQCTSDAAGACQCVPIAPPTPPPTPPQPCAAVPCGGPCVIAPPCPPGGPCPNYVIQGECRDDASGTCQCIPMSVFTPTPAPTCATDADCNDGDACTVDQCVNGICEHACICLTATGAPACCPGPAALCARPCGADASGACGGTCPAGAKCGTLPTALAACGCVSGVGGPCGGNILAPAPECAPGLICQHSNPDVTGVCVAPNPNCIPLFASGCSQTSDCCTPCGNGTGPPCGVCINGSCIGAP